MQDKIFYYHFKRLNAWLVFNTVITVISVYALVGCACLFYWPQVWVILGVLLFSWLMWGYKYLLRHRAVVVNDEFIKIDHTNPLYWRDVVSAQEKIVRCGFRRLRVLTLQPREGIEYRYNFLQKHNAGFTAFSIPLYGILTPEDEQELQKIILEKVQTQKL